MLKNYFTVAFRNLWRNRQFTVINIAGLALGIAVFIFITQYMAFEWNANRFNKNYNELYRVSVQYKEGNTDYFIPPGFAPLIKKQLPAIENYVRVSDGIAGGVLTYQAQSSADSKVFRESNIAYVDGSFLDVFSFPLITGSASLAKPKTLALSEVLSRKIFGTTDVIIASPIAWYFMHQWLQDFAYRIIISWWIFLFAGVTAILIALLTVSFQAIKAAIANPVKSLRME